MTTPISGFSLPPLAFGSPTQGAAVDAGGPGFAELLQAAGERGTAMQHEADATLLNALQGGNVTEIEAMTAMKKADLALKMMIQVRNKTLDAYNEIQQMRF